MGTVSCFHSFNFVSFIWSPTIKLISLLSGFIYVIIMSYWMLCAMNSSEHFCVQYGWAKKTIKSYVSKVLRWRLNATQIKKSWIHNTTRSFFKNKAFRCKCSALMLLPLVSLWPTVDKTNPINIWLMENVNLKQISYVQTWLWNYKLHMHLCFQLIFAGAN